LNPAKKECDDQDRKQNVPGKSAGEQSVEERANGHELSFRNEKEALYSKLCLY
jgi:hypothetical protein